MENEIAEGYYRTRTEPGGTWAPVRIWLEDGERDESGDLLSDQLWRAKWAPATNEVRWYPIDPFESSGWDMPRFRWFDQITKEEYEWLILLKTL